MILTKLKWSLTEKEKILNADILQVLHVGQCNISFSRAANDAALFQQMFSDSSIAANYTQSYTRCLIS